MTHDIESLLDNIETFLKANLNTQITALNAEKADSITLGPVDASAFFYQSLNSKITNVDPFVFFGVINSVSDGLGPATATDYTVQVVIVKNDSGNDDDIDKKVLRYGRVLKDLFEINWSSISRNDKFKVSSLEPASINGLLNNSSRYRVVGVNLETTIS